MRFKTKPRLHLFIAISVALHLMAGTAIYFLTPEKKPPPKETPIFVRIVPAEPQPPVPDEKPPEALNGGPAPRLPAVKKSLPPAPPKEQTAKAPKTQPRPETQARKAPEEKKPEPEMKEAKGAVPPKDEELRDKGAAPEARAEEPGGLTGKGKDETGGVRAGEAGRNRLFDKDVLSGVIAKGKSPAEQDNSITFDTREIRYYSYMRKLKERIEAVWDYPRKAAEEGIYGDLLVRFVIKKDGSLGSVELVRTSGWRMLDQAAIEALRDGAPYWPLPEEWGTDSLTVTGHFIYTLYGYYYVR